MRTQIEKLTLMVTAVAVLSISLCLAAEAKPIGVDTIRTTVGMATRIPLILERTWTSDSNDVTIKVILSNTSVIYVDSISVNPPIHVSRWNIERPTNDFDSISTISASLVGSDSAPARLTMIVHCTALAGNDSLCFIQFQGGHSGDSLYSDSVLVISSSIGTPLPYVRFARLLANRPNPVSRLEETTWTYRLDKSSTVTFTIYDLRGREMFYDAVRDVQAGVHRYNFIPSLEFDAGVYFLLFQSSSGFATHSFNVYPR